MLTVTVNDRPIDVPAIVERGRVFLPIRTVFTALGASVTYDGRQGVIVARHASHELRLPIASDPVRVFEGRAYVPLRYVAESMGARVAYDAHSQTIRVTEQSVAVTGLSPAPDAAVSSAYPTIAATIATANAVGRDVVLRVDGKDVTPLATFDGSTITYLPREAFYLGHHSVSFSGRTLSREPFSASWSFDTTMNPPPQDNTPAFTAFDYRLYADRNAFYSGDWMHFTLVAPPGGTARLQLCNLGLEYPLSYGGYGNVYRIDVPAPIGYEVPSCPVTAVYTSWTGQKVYVPVPYVIAIYTRPAARATPRPTPKPTPKQTPQPRRIESAPAHPVPADTSTIRGASPMPRRTESTPKPVATSAPRSLQRDRPSPRTTPGQ